MQFQPYKGGGGPDFLSLALNLRQQRNQEESQRRRDEAALIRAESQAKNDELTRAEKRLNILKTYRDTLGGASQTAQAAGQMGDERMQRAPEFLTNPDFQGPLQAPDQELQQQFPTPESFAVTQYPEYQTLVNRRANQLIQGGVDPAMAVEQAARDLDVQQRVTLNERQRLLDEQIAKEEREAAAIEDRAVRSDKRLEGRQKRARKADARMAAYTPERFGIAAEGFAAELDAAPDDDTKNAILERAGQYAVEVAGALGENLEVVRSRLNRRIDGALAARDLKIKDDLPNRQARIDERVALVTEDASVAYRASQNAKLSDTQRAAALAKLDALVDPLVAEYAAAYNVTPGQARRTIMAPVQGSPVVRAQVLQEQGVNITSKAIAEANSEVGALESLDRDLRDAKRERNSTDDPDRIAALDGRIQAIINVRAGLMAGEGEQPFSSGDRVKTIQSYLSGRGAMETTGELLALIESGQLKTGPAGFLTSLGLRVQELANDILRDPEVPDEMKAFVQQLEQSGNGQISYRTTAGSSLRGKQLNLAADQLFLAWEIVKAKRESARFTLLELQSTLELVDFTDPTKPRVQMEEQLRKVVRLQNSASGISGVMLRRMGIDPDVLFDEYRQETGRSSIDRPAPASQPRASADAAAGADQSTATPAVNLAPGDDGYARSVAQRIIDGTYTPGAK